MMSDEFPKDCDVEDEEGLAEFSVHVNSHQDRLAVQTEKLGAGSLHDTESKMEDRSSRSSCSVRMSPR